jgi:two-component system response regulator HydG
MRRHAMHKRRPAVLIVDREGEDARRLVPFLRRQGFDPTWSPTADSDFNALDAAPPDALLFALRAQRIDGPKVLRRALQRNPELCAVAIVAPADLERGIEAMRAGACDFQPRPLHPARLLATLQRGLAHQRLAARAADLERQLDARFGFEALIGRSRALARAVEQLRQIAATRATVLLEGEPGTGKRLAAQAIHHNSPRAAEPFVWVDLGAVAEGVVESDLFGDASAAERGEPALRRGRFELAEGGTLFLDEIGEAPAAAQVKLLRAIHDRSFERLGGPETLKADVRLVIATERDLAADVAAGRFRADLYERLSPVRVRMPPLRERAEDIPLLVEAFIREFDRAHARRVTGVTRGVLERLMRWTWPGNVRELRNAIEGMVVFAHGRRPLDLSDLPDGLRGVDAGEASLALAVGMTVEEAERQLIAATLRHTGYDKPRAAAMLGIGLRTLYRKIKQYAIH